MAHITRRILLGSAAVFGWSGYALSRTVSGSLPWAPNDAAPPVAVHPGPWLFLTAAEAAAVDAIIARLIPSDELGQGAREAGGTTFIDRQLAGPYGGHDWLYMQGPFAAAPLPSQGLQSPVTPRDQYRQGLAALEQYCRSTFGGRLFAGLPVPDQDALLAGLESGAVTLPNTDGRALFAIVLANTIEGYFADPIYGGNRDMAGWQLLGFPGTRYDYRNVLERPNQPYTSPPVGLQGRPAWGPA